MSRIHSTFLAIAAFLLALLIPGPAAAVPYQAGPHVLDLDIRNSTMLLIPQAKARVSFKNGKIRVYAWARGYQSVKETIEVGTAEPSLIKRDVMLPDPMISAYAMNLEDTPIDSVYFQTDQWGVAPDKFRITTFIPQKEWPLASPERLQLLGSSIGAPVKYSCSIDQVEEFYRINLEIARGHLNDNEFLFTVMFDTGTGMPSAVRGKLCRHLTGSLRPEDPDAPEAARSLCRFLSMIDERSLGSASDQDPDLLKQFKAQRKRFDELHEVVAR